MHYVPKHLKTPDLCKIAVKEYGMALKHIPEELKTLGLCRLAIQQNGDALEYVPESLRLHFKDLNDCAISIDIYKQDIDKLKNSYYE